MRRRRGLSLLETMIAMAVASLFGIALLQLFTTGLRLYVRSQGRADLQSQGNVAMGRLADDLRRSAMATVTVIPGKGRRGAAVAFRPTDPDRQGQSAFTPAPWFVLYTVDRRTRTMVTKRWPAPTGEPLDLDPDPIRVQRRLTPSEVALILDTPNGTERRLAGNVDRLAVTPSSYPTLDKLTGLGLELVLRNEGSGDQATLATRVTPRNKP